MQQDSQNQLENNQIPPIHGKKDFKLAPFLSLDQFDHLGIEHVLTRTGNIKKNPIKYNKLAKGKVLISIFEPKFELEKLTTQMAWTKLGGTVLDLPNNNHNFENRMRFLVDTQPDFVALQSSDEYDCKKAFEYLPDFKWINCGDQNTPNPFLIIALLFQLQDRLEDISKLKIAFVGNLKTSQNCQSLVRLLQQYDTQLCFFAEVDEHISHMFGEGELAYNGQDIDQIDNSKNQFDAIFVVTAQNIRPIYKEDVIEYEKLEIKPDFLPNDENQMWVQMSILSLLMGI
jgi:aspartate carbamoyltransferase catalytic subunit